jgi:hypothetical protein
MQLTEYTTDTWIYLFIIFVDCLSNWNYNFDKVQNPDNLCMITHSSTGYAEHRN